MTHADARLTFHGRCLLVRRGVHDLRPVAHVAKELGVSRQCAHRWVARFHCPGRPRRRLTGLGHGRGTFRRPPRSAQPRAIPR
ncbi:leucine zipper domain-containing protein [Streptomyces sp. NPDC001817]|uniref:leucine zipper domain-containing protein n=1 Tax=Streptomyces sp. NPDC001817 TaxID=3154398 RepID=UPI00331EB19F